MKKNSNTEQEAKAPASYPYYDLEACIKFASHIKELGGSKGGIQKSILAKQVGLSETTPSFFQTLSATKVFGLIDGWGSYNLTELGRKYFYPQSEIDKKTALLEAFARPAAFQLILKKFDGETLPKTEIMGNIFHQELGIPDSWKDRVAQICVRSAQFAGIIDNGGFLRYDAAVHISKAENPEAPKPQEPPAPAEAPARISDLIVPPSQRTVTQPAGYYSNPEVKEVWSSGTIRVETPLNISSEAWAKLNAYVQVLNPSPSVLNEENLILRVLNDLNGLGKSEGQISSETGLSVPQVSRVLDRRPEMFTRGADFLWRKNK